MQGIPRTSIGRVMRYWYFMHMSCLQHCQLLHILVRGQFVNFPYLLSTRLPITSVTNCCCLKPVTVTRLLFWPITKGTESTAPVKTQLKLNLNILLSSRKSVWSRVSQDDGFFDWTRKWHKIFKAETHDATNRCDTSPWQVAATNCLVWHVKIIVAVTEFCRCDMSHEFNAATK